MTCPLLLNRLVEAIQTFAAFTRMQVRMSVLLIPYLIFGWTAVGVDRSGDGVVGG